MKSVISRVYLAVALLGAVFGSSMVSAATFAQSGAAFNATGTIATGIKMLLWTPIPCGVALTGRVAADGFSATITGATFTGNALCNIAGPLNLPWTLVPTSANTVTISGFMQKFAYDSCATPSVVAMQWSAADETFSLTSPHTVNSTCRLTTFNFKPSSALTITP